MNARNILIFVGVSVLCIAMIFGGSILSVLNANADLRAQFSAQEDNNQIVFDKFKKILQEKAGVVNASQASLRELYGIVMSSKQGVDGAGLMKFIQQHNPNPNFGDQTALFKDLMVSIEQLRNEFAREQQKSRSIQQEHDRLRTRPISGTLLSIFSDNSPLETNIITSSETQETFESGTDNNVFRMELQTQ